MIKKHLSKETRQKISRALKGRPLSEINKIRIGDANRGKKKDSISQEKHWNWKGGLPKCIDCHKRIANRSAKRCVTCNGKCMAGNKSSFWKGGISKQNGYSTFMSRKRKIAKRGNGGTHTLIDWLALKIKYQFMCLCCKKTEPEIVLTEDHIIPISKGGTDDILNIQPLCFSCNSIKRVKVQDFRNILKMG